MLSFFVITFYLLVFQSSMFFMANNTISAFKKQNNKIDFEVVLSFLMFLGAEILSFILILSEFFPLLVEANILK